MNLSDLPCNTVQPLGPDDASRQKLTREQLNERAYARTVKYRKAHPEVAKQFRRRHQLRQSIKIVKRQLTELPKKLARLERELANLNRKRPSSPGAGILRRCRIPDSSGG